MVGAGGERLFVRRRYVADLLLTRKKCICASFEPMEQAKRASEPQAQRLVLVLGPRSSMPSLPALKQPDRWARVWLRLRSETGRAVGG